MGNTLSILKTAILMEKKGQSLYLKAAEHARDDAVKSFFTDMAEEEQTHIDILERQFKAVMADGRFMSGSLKDDAGAPQAILDEKIKQKIDAAGFEATAITAAIGFEERAVKAYGQRAEQSDDPEEKKIFAWLSAWEKTHLDKLVALEESLMEKVWEDNNFWPM